MNRLLPHLAAALLCGASLAACSSASGEPKAAAATQTSDAASTGLPTDLEGEIHRAQDLRAQGNLDEAIRALGQLMLVAPDDPRIVAEYGKVLTQQDRPQEAVEFLNRATQLSPGDWTIYSALGVAYDQAGDQVKARAAYEHALALKPGDPVILNNYALSRLLAGDQAAAQRLIAQAQAAGADPKIARNVAYIANYGPTKPVAAAIQVAPKPATSVASAPVSAAPMTVKPASGVATAAPRQLNPNVVMQAVPSDPLAGPVGRHAHQVAAKPVAGKPAAAAAKPEVADKKNKTPALRMSADASE